MLMRADLHFHMMGSIYISVRIVKEGQEVMTFMWRGGVIVNGGMWLLLEKPLTRIMTS